MIDGPFRSYLAPRVQALIDIYIRLGITPNQISMAGFAFGAFAAIFTALGAGIVAVLLWWAGRLLDGTDGIYARATGQTSSFGAYLDIVCDMAAYSAMLLGFFVLHPELGFWWLAISILYTLCITSALAMGNIEQALQLAHSDNRGLRLGAGLAEGGETGIAYTMFLVFPGAIHWLVPFWLLILIVTVVSRSLLVRRITRG